MPLVDPGNPLLAQVPAAWEAGAVPTPDGQRGIITIRTPDTTLTLMVSKQDLQEVIARLTELDGMLSSSGLATVLEPSAAGPSRLIRPGRRG